MSLVSGSYPPTAPPDPGCAPKALLLGLPLRRDPHEPVATRRVFKLASHSITSSARARSQSGTVRPSAVAVFNEHRREATAPRRLRSFAGMRSTRVTVLEALILIWPIGHQPGQKKKKKKKKKDARRVAIRWRLRVVKGVADDQDTVRISRFMAANASSKSSGSRTPKGWISTPASGRLLPSRDSEVSCRDQPRSRAPPHGAARVRPP